MCLRTSNFIAQIEKHDLLLYIWLKRKQLKGYSQLIKKYHMAKIRHHFLFSWGPTSGVPTNPKNEGVAALV